MLSHWYKTRRARKLAPLLLGWSVICPVIGAGALMLARVSGQHPLAPSNGLADLAVGTWMMIAIAAFVFGITGLMRLIHLILEAKQPLPALLRVEDE